MPAVNVAKAKTLPATAAIADACLRLGLPPRIAPAGLEPLEPGTRISGPVRPARHAGSVDVFLEAIERSNAGEVLVIDNGGRTDEACIGDLSMIEAKFASLAGCLVWGLHRDTQELRQIRVPVFSYGRFPQGPVGARPRPTDALDRAQFGTFWVEAGDYVVADDDGAVFVPTKRLEAVLTSAQEIQAREQAQADRVRKGENLRRQFHFAEYLKKRSRQPQLTFRDHLRTLQAEIEQ